MSRTKRNIPHRWHWCSWFKHPVWKRIPDLWMRNPKTQSTRRLEGQALAMLESEGFSGTNRLKTRANPTGVIPDAYDDLRVAALWELDYDSK